MEYAQYKRMKEIRRTMHSNGPSTRPESEIWARGYIQGLFDHDVIDIEMYEQLDMWING